MKKTICILTALGIYLTGCSMGSSTKRQKPAKPVGNGNVTVDFLKVGKADAMVIQTMGHVVVIDCGEESDGEKVCKHLEDNGIKHIDEMILTHYDKDHIGGAAQVIGSFSVDNIISPDYHEGSKEFAKMCDAMDLKSVNFENPDDLLEFTLDDAEFQVYPCKQWSYRTGNDNNHSLIVRMKHHEKVFIFAGDAMEERLAEIMDIGDCDVLKEPYHGRDIANLGEFLDKTTPEYAIISTDKESMSKSVKKLFSDRNIETYITYKTGNIRCISDGTEIHFETGKG